jgi:hypothetical protein
MLLCLVLAVISCKKREALPVASKYSFTNILDRDITLDVYGSLDDYNNTRGCISKHHIPASATVEIFLDTRRSYWVDWYTPDYSFTNWVDSKHSGGGPFSDAQPLPQIDVAMEDDHFNIQVSKMDSSRSVLLNDTGLSSTWQTRISDVPELNGTHTFRLGRDFSCAYTYEGDAGPVTRQITFAVHNEQPPSFSAILYDELKRPFAELFFNHKFDGYTLSGRDTLLLLVYNNQTGNYGKLFPAGRQ